MDFSERDREPAQSYTLEGFLATIKRRRKLIGIVFVCAVLGAYAALQFISDKYEAEAALLVKLGRENVEVPTSVTRGGVYSTGVRKEDINSEIRLLRSRMLSEEVVDTIGVGVFKAVAPPPHGLVSTAKFYAKRGYTAARQQVDKGLIALNLQKDLDDREKAVELLQGSITVDLEKEADVINIHMKMTNPELARQTVEVLLKRFMEHRTDARRDMGVRDFFDHQFAISEHELNAVQSQIMAAKTQWGISSAADQRKLLLERINELRRLINASETERDSMQARQLAIESRMKDLPDRLEMSQVLMQNPTFISIKERMAVADLERARYGGMLMQNSSTVNGLERQRSILDSMLKKESKDDVGSVTMELNPIKQEFNRELEESRVRLASIQATIALNTKQADAVGQELARLDQGEDKLAVLDRERNIAEQKYLAYSQRREEARIADEEDRRRISNIAILTPPMVASTPVYPRKMLIMGISLAAGLLLGIGFALAVEYLNDRVYVRRDVEGIAGVTFLGTFGDRQSTRNGGKVPVGSKN